MRFQVFSKRDVFTLSALAILSAGYFIHSKVSANILEDQKKEIVEGIIAGRALIHSGQFTFGSDESSCDDNICYFEEGKLRREKNISGIVKSPVNVSNIIEVSKGGETRILWVDANSKPFQGEIKTYPAEYSTYHMDKYENLHQLKHSFGPNKIELWIKNEIYKDEKITKISDDELNGLKCKKIHFKSKYFAGDTWICPEYNYAFVKEESGSETGRTFYTADFEKINGIWVLKKYTCITEKFDGKTSKITEQAVLNNWKINIDLPDELFELEFPRTKSLVKERPSGTRYQF